jgi:hypothetical protein
MKRVLLFMVSISIFAIAILFPATTSGSAGQTKKSNDSSGFKIGYLGDRSIPDGCNCTFTSLSQMHRKSPRYMFASDIEDDEKTAWINIDGKDIELKLLSRLDPRREKVGSRSGRTYTATGIKLVATYIVTWVCPPKDEACEVTRYDGVFLITKNGPTRSLKLKGECGC